MAMLSLAAALGTAAQAAISESASIIENRISYSFDHVNFTEFAIPGNTHQVFDSNNAGALSQIGVDVTSSVGGGQFSWLQNAYCLGSCSVGVTTIIEFVLTNTGSTAEQVRFDSLITPGHLARYDKPGESAQGGFIFDVFQHRPSDPDDTYFQLYQATNTFYHTDPGSSQLGPGFIVYAPGTSDPWGGTFSGFDYQDSGVGWQSVDWSATNLNLTLDTILPGETHYLYYKSFVYGSAGIDTPGICTDLADCQGVQVAFGDPRTTGAGSSSLAPASWLRSFSPNSVDLSSEPVLGRKFKSYVNPVAFAPDGSPLPTQPDPLPKVVYNGPTFNVAVPEPASWLLMIGGFALLGAMLRGAPRSAPPVPV